MIEVVWIGLVDEICCREKQSNQARLAHTLLELWTIDGLGAIVALVLNGQPQRHLSIGTLANGCVLQLLVNKVKVVVIPGRE